MRFHGLFILLAGLCAACTTTSTVGDNGDEPGAGKDPGAGKGPGASSDLPKEPGSTSPVAPTAQVVAPDTKGVVSVSVTARYYLGQINPITGKQEDGTSIQIQLRSEDVVEPAWPTGTPGTCVSKPNAPSSPPDRALDIAMSAVVSALGEAKPTQYDDRNKHAATAFRPPLPDGTPITVTFGSEIPALAGKSVTLPAVTSQLAIPTLKPFGGIREYRRYAPGTDLTMSWSPVAGKKIVLAGNTGKSTPTTSLNCFLDDAATSVAVPAATMAAFTASADPATDFPPVFIISRIDTSESFNGVVVRKASLASMFFQLNMNP